MATSSLYYLLITFKFVLSLISRKKCFNYCCLIYIKFFFRSSDGLLLIVSSSDGFCSIVSFSEGELGVPYTDNTKIVVTETEESMVLDDIEDVPNNDQLTPPEKIKPKDEKPTADYSEPLTKKRVQLVTLSSPKTKKYLNK